MSGNQVDHLGEQSLYMETPNAATSLVKNDIYNKSQEELMEGLNFGNVQAP